MNDRFSKTFLKITRSQCDCTQTYFKDIFKNNNAFVLNHLPNTGSRHKPQTWSRMKTLQTQKPHIARSFISVYNKKKKKQRRSVIDYFWLSAVFTVVHNGMNIRDVTVIFVSLYSQFFIELPSFSLNFQVMIKNLLCSSLLQLPCTRLVL